MYTKNPFIHNKYMERKKTITKFIVYGLFGICLEIFFTGFMALIRMDLTMKGNSYIWMFFIYGLAVFLEPIHNALRKRNIFLRGLIYTIIIYLVEYASGFLLIQLIGRSPWYYTDEGSINGLITLSFIPVWFVLGLIFEKAHDYMDVVLRKIYE